MPGNKRAPGGGRKKQYDSQLRVLVTDEQEAALKAVAAQRDVPTAQVVRDLINDALLTKEGASR